MDHNSSCQSISSGGTFDYSSELFYQIAKAMKEKGVTVRDLYNKKIISQIIKEQKIETIRCEDFKEGIYSLGVDFNKVEFECILAKLVKNTSQESISISDFIDSIDGFNIYDEDELIDTDSVIKIESDTEEEKESSDGIDAASSNILYELHNYLLLRNIDIPTLFANSIQMCFVEGQICKGITQNAFFEILNTIGVKEMEYGNLLDVLAFENTRYTKMISLDKLQKLIQSLAKKNIITSNQHKSKL